MVRRLASFRRAERGASLVEGLIAFPLILLVFAVFIEVGFLMHTYNQNTKAVAVGARIAAVSDPMMDLAPLTAGISTTIPAGDPLPPPDADDAVFCTAATCNAEFGRMIFGSDGVCDPGAAPSATNAVYGMCDISGSFELEDVVVTYARSGLGYYKRPGPPVVSITVRIDPRTVNLFLLDGLIDAFGGDLAAIAFPEISATITSEDLSSTPL